MTSVPGSADAGAVAAQGAEPKPPETAPIVPKSELAFVKQMPTHVTQVASDVGYPAPQTLVALAPSALKIVVQLPLDQSKLLQQGSVADIYLAEDNVIKGKVVAQDDQSADAGKDGKQDPDSKNLKFTIAPDSPLDFSLAGKNIKVIFVLASTSGDVLGVPLGAVSSNSAGETSVVKVDEHENMAPIKVKLGVNGNGIVEIIPADPNALQENDKVLIGR
jgi:hypothetical protein